MQPGDSEFDNHGQRIKRPPMIIMSRTPAPLHLLRALLSLGKLQQEPAIREFDGSFAAIRRSKERVARQHPLGLPAAFRLPLPGPRIDHPPSGRPVVVWSAGGGGRSRPVPTPRVRFIQRSPPRHSTSLRQSACSRSDSPHPATPWSVFQDGSGVPGGQPHHTPPSSRLLPHFRSRNFTSPSRMLFSVPSHY